MRNHAQDANLSRRIGDRGDHSLSASASAAPTSAATDGQLSGWNDGPGGHDMPGSAAATASPAAGAAFRRTRLILRGRRTCAGRRFAAYRVADSCPVDRRLTLAQSKKAEPSGPAFFPVAPVEIG
jgi:hypothetical protein